MTFQVCPHFLKQIANLAIGKCELRNEQLCDKLRKTSETIATRKFSCTYQLSYRCLLSWFLCWCRTDHFSSLAFTFLVSRQPNLTVMIFYQTYKLYILSAGILPTSMVRLFYIVHLFLQFEDHTTFLMYCCIQTSLDLWSEDLRDDNKINL